MTAERTIGGLLQAAGEQLRASGSPTPRLDAELLLGNVLGTDRAALLAHPTVEVSSGQAARYEQHVGRRAAGEPVAYIRGIKEFYGLAFMVDRRALIPRPETELLVDIALGRISDALTSAPRPAGKPPLLIADVGTGAGAVAVSLAVECRRRGYGADVSFIAADDDPDALGLARENGVGHGVADLVQFVIADLVPPSDRPFDLIAANLPYIRSADVPELPIAASFEPRHALDGGPDGLTVIGRLIERLPAELAVSGVALIEIGAEQAAAVERLVAEALAGWTATVHTDLAGQPRVAEVARSSAT